MLEYHASLRDASCSLYVVGTHEMFRWNRGDLKKTSRTKNRIKKQNEKLFDAMVVPSGTFGG